MRIVYGDTSFLFTGDAELQEIIEQLNRCGAEVKTGEIYPTDTVPVPANNKSMVITTSAMKWGYTLPDGKQIESIRSSQT